jgi:hypothetical protein
MANVNGLIAPPAYKNPEVPYYLADDAGTVINQPTLVSAIDLESTDRTAVAQLSVVGLEGTPPALSVYSGSIGLRPGTSSLGAAPAGVNIRSLANGVAVEVGTDGVGIVNTLGVAGADGVAQVYDEIYNQPVSLQPIALSSTNPLCAPTPGNTGEIFRCNQDGVLASATTAIGTAFQVPRSGWYALQIEVKLGNAPAPAAPTINVPITVAPGGVNLGENLSFAIIKGVVVEPYGLQEVSSNELAVAPILVANTITVRSYASLHLFDSTETYTFTLSSSSAVWNIGAAGQLKAELIAMC